MTFLFTDIEGSTRRWETDPEAMRTALVLHDEVLRSAIEAHGGWLFKHTGDGVCAAFGSARESIDAAVAAQGGLELPVRMGVASGEVQERDGDYFGPTLNRVARIMAAGHGGQVLVSDATAKLLAGDGSMRDLGEYRLRDLASWERVWQVGGREFPRLRCEPARAGNLPLVSRSFVGRVDDCKRLAVEAQPGRVVTLTGPGGVGKTRLALEVAHNLATEFADGVWWCDLAPLDDPAAVAAAVAATLAVVPQADMTASEAVVDSLRGRQAMVVFDNCEHLLAEVAALIDAVADGCPTVAVVATSREPLGVRPERVWPVRSLDPDLEGAELFMERAMAADATFTVGGERGLLVELCRHLDGIPLAIELAAARVRALTIGELVAGLGDRFRLLRGGGRGGLDRHRTLTATLDWSYGLLTAAERVLLDRLAVFAGSFDRTAVEAICADDVIDRSEVFDGLASLVDKSTVAAERTAGGMRYRLLETVRQYAESHAVERGELADLRDRHLAYFVTVAETAFTAWLADYTSGRVVFEQEWDNLRAAIQHALSVQDVAELERLFAAVQWHSLYALRFEIADWATEAAELPGAGPATFSTVALITAFLGQAEQAERFGRAGIASAASPRSGDTSTSWLGLAFSLLQQGEPDAAREAFVTVIETGGGGEFMDAVMSAFVASRDVATDPLGAAVRARHAEALIADRRNPAMTADTLSNLSPYYAQAGDPDRGVDYCRQAITIARDHDAPISVHTAHGYLAQLAVMGGTDDPVHTLCEAIKDAYRDRSWIHVWGIVAALAVWWVTHDQPEPAAVTVGYLDAHHIRQVFGHDHLDSARAALSDHTDSGPWLAHGAGLDRDQLVAYVLDRDQTPE